MRRTPRIWVGRILLAIVGPLFWLELVLQVGSFFTPNAPSDADAEATADPCCVLCVGDSFTFGLGATTPAGSYPAQLEANLRAAPLAGRWRVANGGVPSRNSRDVLLDLPRAFRRARPRYVAILVGVNDLWSHPERADLHEAAKLPPPAPGWRLEWRTRKFVRLLWSDRRQGGLFADKPPVAALGSTSPATTNVAEKSAAVADTSAATAAVKRAKKPAEVEVCYSDQIVGCWSGAAEALSFARDGRGRRGAAPIRWRIARAGEIELDRCDGTAPTRVTAKTRVRLLLLAAPGAKDPAIYRRVDDPQPSKPAAWEWFGEHDRLLKIGDRAGVLAFTQRWVVAQPDEAWAWLGYLDAAEKAGRRDLYPAGLAALERIERATGGCDAVESLQYGYRKASQIQRAADLAREEVVRFPGSAALHQELAGDADRVGDFAAAVREMTLAIDHAGERGDDVDRVTAGFRLRERARWNQLLKRDAAAATDAILASRASPDEQLDRQLLMRADFKESAFESALAAMDASDAERAAVHRRFADVHEALSTPSAVLIDHLAQMARWVREQGAEPLFLTYPFQGGVIDEAQRAAACQEHVELVEISVRFTDLLETHARDDLFVGDGHCNDAGYRVVAEEVAGALRKIAH